MQILSSISFMNPNQVEKEDLTECTMTNVTADKNALWACTSSLTYTIPHLSVNVLRVQCRMALSQNISYTIDKVSSVTKGKGPILGVPLTSSAQKLCLHCRALIYLLYILAQY